MKFLVSTSLINQILLWSFDVEESDWFYVLPKKKQRVEQSQLILSSVGPKLKPPPQTT